MTNVKERITENIADLNETQLDELAQYLEFLKFRAERNAKPNLTELTDLYAEFAEDDRELAEIGISNYESDLRKEDSAR